MATHPTGEDHNQDAAGAPADGPGRGEPGPGGDHGATSQDKPSASAAGQGEGVEERAGHPPGEPADSNERADDRATVVGPDAADPAPNPKDRRPPA